MSYNTFYYTHFDAGIVPYLTSSVIFPNSGTKRNSRLIISAHAEHCGRKKEIQEGRKEYRSLHSLTKFMYHYRRKAIWRKSII